MFDKEEWRILPSEEETVYADVLSNDVLIEPSRGNTYFVRIVIPSDLFSYLKDGLHISTEAMAGDSPQLCLYEDDGSWFFSMYMSDGDGTYVFWKYTKLPLWALRHPR